MKIDRPTLKRVLRLGDPSDTTATMRITSPYGPRGGGFHAAIDIGNYVAGDTLTACADMTILGSGYLGPPWSDPKPSDAWWLAQKAGPFAGQRGGLYGPPSKWAGPVWGGQQIIGDLGSGWIAGYAHCDSVDVKAGQRVGIGEVLGILGDSGSAYLQPHLHFGLRFSGALGNGHEGWVDPEPLIYGGPHPHDQEDDMPTFGADEVRPVTAAPEYRVTTDAWFRSEPRVATETQLLILPVGSAVQAAYRVTGEKAGDSDQWVETRKWVIPAGGKGRNQIGYVHTSVVERVDQPAGLPADELEKIEDAAFIRGRDAAVAAGSAVQP